MKMYNAGQLRDKCKIVELRTTIDESGFHEESYILKYSLKCFISQITVTQSLTANRSVNTTKTTVIIRKKDNITDKDSLIINEEIFKIIYIKKELSVQYMELIVEKVE
ncbi:phage head closure protein [Clostridium butyricum]|uniref:phage head closure protein n=1 Tax=Clostridium butyricum TaxID=1492 RepID=UPI002AB2710D|nr:phage head closure protein [Clostridium butyricum]